MIRRASVTYFFYTLVYLLAFMLCKITDTTMKDVQTADIVIASMITASFYLIWLFASTRKHPNVSKAIVLACFLLLFVISYIMQTQAQTQTQRTDNVFFFLPSYWVVLFTTLSICWVCEYQVQEYQEEKREEEIRRGLGEGKGKK